MKAYIPTDAQKKMLETNFVYHAPKEDQPERYITLRAQMKELAVMVITLTPISREQSLALTKLEECMMWANAAIARNE